MKQGGVKVDSGFDEWFTHFRNRVKGWEADQVRAWLKVAWDAAESAALETVLELHHPIVRRPGWPPTCSFDNHRWPCPEAEIISRTLDVTQTPSRRAAR